MPPALHSLPPRSAPQLQQYLQRRQELEADEHSIRADAEFRKSLSPVEKEACDIVHRIRNHEMRTVWTPDVEEALAVERHEAVFPGMMFMQAKDRMEGTHLWRIVRKMPKGCLLHCHMDAMGDFEHLLAELMKLPGIHLSSDRPLATVEARANARLNFRYRKNRDTENDAIWKSDYRPHNFVLLTEAADAFPDGGRRAFLDWVVSRCMLSSTDSHEQHHGIDAIWKKFEKCFSVVFSMTQYEPMLRCLMRRLMSVLKDDGINWVEIRHVAKKPQCGWPLNYCRDQQEEPEKDYSHVFQVIEEEVARFKTSEEGQGFWGVTFIWCSRRAADSTRILSDMSHCIATKKQFPHLISGFDLVGHEDSGRPFDDLLPELFWFTEECKKEGLRIPFFFHAGETLGDGDAIDKNLFDAILLGTRRIGHGFSLYKHPKLMTMVKEKQILIESCPISNEVLRLCGSIMAHTLPALLAQGVPCCLNNDGPAILGQKSTGVSHDFWQALQGWENLGLAGLGSLAENSIRWASFQDEDDDDWLAGIQSSGSGSGSKDERLRIWRADWERFCAWIVDEYAGDFYKAI